LEREFDFNTVLLHRRAEERGKEIKKKFCPNNFICYTTVKIEGKRRGNE
jgi:hypothetical protein